MTESTAVRAAQLDPESSPTKTRPDDHDARQHGGLTSMQGALGPYSMMREASGTSWQPDSTPMDMTQYQYGEWGLMAMGIVNAIYTHAEARHRGGQSAFVSSMGMLLARRDLGVGTLSLHTMVSLDPAFVPKGGYPLLFQTGETADGKTPLIDHQHPHDLFMELAAAYSLPLAERRSVFVYAGLPGEPALGPVTYMHRASGLDDPETPISHHWLDSTHITYGVVTVGWVANELKLEASAFNAREPDQHRYDIEARSLDSWSARATYNPAPNWSVQVSFGRLISPEQLQPNLNVDRTTASITYNHPLERGAWQSTLAVGRNQERSGDRTDAYLLESALPLSARVTAFARAERVGKDELFNESSPLTGRVFTINKVSFGAIYDFAQARAGRFGLGALYSLHFIPTDLETVYGKQPQSGLVFLRWIFT